MGDDVNNGGVYKFVSELPLPARSTLGEPPRSCRRGKLYIARWEPLEPAAPTTRPGATSISVDLAGPGSWREVKRDRARRHAGGRDHEKPAEGAGFLQHFATNRPEDVEVDEDGTVYIALTNNTSAGGPYDVHGSIRRLREAGRRPDRGRRRKLFAWEDFAAGGPSGLRRLG